MELCVVRCSVVDEISQSVDISSGSRSGGVVLRPSAHDNGPRLPLTPVSCQLSLNRGFAWNKH